MSERCACVYPQPPHIQLLARGFDQAAIATQSATTRRNLAQRPRAAIGPQHHLTAMALLAGIGLDGGTSAHVDRMGMWHSRVAALVTASDQNLSTTSATGGKDVRIEQTHLMASSQHATSLLSRPGAHVQRAPQAHRAAVHAAQQHDGALPVFHGLCLHYARVVHRVGQQVARCLGAHDHLTAVGLQQAAIAQQGIGHALVHAHAQQPITQHIQRHGLTSRHGHAATRSHDSAQVVDLSPQQGHIAAVGRLQCTLIEQLGSACTRKPVAPGHEVAVVDVQRRGHQAPHIDRSPRPEQDAVWIDQKHLTVGRQAAQNRGGFCTGHPIERHRVSARLHELHRLARRNSKALPVDRHMRRVLRDCGLTGQLRDAGAACTHQAAVGCGHGQPAPGQHHGQRQRPPSPDSLAICKRHCTWDSAKHRRGGRATTRCGVFASGHTGAGARVPEGSENMVHDRVLGIGEMHKANGECFGSASRQARLRST